MRVPRVKTPDGQVRQVEVPWARPGSGFTLLLDALAMLLCSDMPMSEAAAMLAIEDTRLWRVVERHVEEAYAKESWKDVRRILIDETSARRGHRYVTNIVDADTRRLLFMCEGRDSSTVAAFATLIVPWPAPWACANFSRIFLPARTPTPSTGGVRVPCARAWSHSRIWLVPSAITALVSSPSSEPESPMASLRPLTD